MAVLLGIQLFLLCLIFRILPRARFLTNYELLVLAFVTLSAVFCVIAEILGLGGWFTPSVLVFVHGLLTLVLAVCSLYVIRRSVSHAPDESEKNDRMAKSCGLNLTAGQCGVFAVALALTVCPFLSAVFAPPSNWDSMAYHLPRAMHWLSQGSLDHYQTYTARQLYLNPGHEIILAHGIGLGGGDRYAGLLNTVAFFVTMVASAGITLRVGGGMFAQAAAVVVTGTIPMAILQASTTQNDLLHGLFLAAALLGMVMVRQGVGVLADGLLWLSVGLALATKGLSFIWVPAIALVAFPWQQYCSRSGIKRAVLGGLVAVLLNSGFWLRNIDSFGHPLAPVGTGPIQFAQYPVETVSVTTLISNLARNIFLHSNTPFFDIGPLLHPGIELLHSSLDLDVNDSGTTLVGTHFRMAEPTRVHEDLAGNGGTLVVALVSSLLLLGMTCKRTRAAATLGMPLLAAGSGLVLTCFILRWQPWGSRLQLPLFIVATPGIAALLCSAVRPLFSLPVLMVLVLAALPYGLRNELRPLVGPNSIISGDDALERYIGQLHLYDEFAHVADRLQAIGCHRIGVVHSEDDWEHGLFASLGMDVAVRACKVPDQHGRYLWLAHRRFRQPTPCALVWFGEDVPEKVGACGRGYRRVEAPRLINVLLPRAQDVEDSAGSGAG